MGNNSRSVYSLQDAIGIFLENAKNAPKKNYSLLYRGHSSTKPSFQPSVFRENMLKDEAQMIQELKRLSPSEFPKTNSAIENLIKMQHYGLPTRLLDFSLNPLVALYFACLDNKNQGEVIVFYEKLEQYNSTIAQNFAKLSSYEGKTEASFKKLLGIKPTKTKSPEQIMESIRNKMEEGYSKKYIFISAIHNNERICRQNGVFMLFGIDINEMPPFEKKTIEFKIKDLKPQYNGMTSHFYVPAEIKNNILLELDAVGINHSFLFPELEHQASYIKQKYKLAGGDNLILEKMMPYLSMTANHS